ncbi:MAG TPA: HD domain-containing protein [Chloroflexota bacterium]|nr:HD domain-containing protein [Chloroflexota bacterium]
MNLPTVQRAQQILAEAHARNPGQWADHSRVAAESARAIAAHHPSLDPDAAYVLGLLHDVGRGAGGSGVADVRHLLDGYRLMLDAGFEDSARICLTHSFPIKQADAFARPWDCPAEDKRFVQDYLDHVEYTAYDRLIQLCDAVALPSGPCLMEKRLVDVALRHGFNALTVARWQAFLSLRHEFEAAAGASIYALLPGVVENTFGFSR